MIVNSVIQNLYDNTALAIEPIVRAHDQVLLYNQDKVLQSFLRNKVSDFHFHPSSGYGYGDTGREVLDKVYASIFNTEDALVRTSLVSGTHAIYIALACTLEKGDLLLSLGKPYDTLQKVIGLAGKEKNSLLGQGIEYYEADLTTILSDPEELGLIVQQRKPKTVFIQRSKGYSLRPSLSIAQIRSFISTIRTFHPAAYIVVDNCYGEFVETEEPSDVGADLIAGSLIKNPGGGLAAGGGYLAGKRLLIEKASNLLTAPGLGKEIGASSADKRLIFQGLFMAPMIVGQALESAVFAAQLFSNAGYTVFPTVTEKRTDIVQAITLHSEQKLKTFCQLIQNNSPIDSTFTPEPTSLPGYTKKVIMAAGTFVQGSSIELSADGPITPPYAVFLQGGLSAAHAKLVLTRIAHEIGKQS